MKITHQTATTASTDAVRRGLDADTIPPTGALRTPRLTESTVAVDVHEWRARWESRCNALVIVGVVLVLQSGLARTEWIAWTAIVLGPLLIVAGGVVLRPRLPWRAPEAVSGSATGTDHEGRSTTGPFPLPVAPAQISRPGRNTPGPGHGTAAVAGLR